MITIPTLSDLYTAIVADIEAQYNDEIPSFTKAILPVIAAVQAGQIWLIYKSLGYLQKNMFVDLADPEASGGTLERFGRVKLNRNPRPAVPGQYSISVTGDVGAVIAANTTFKSDEDSLSPGKLYVVDEDFELESSPDLMVVRALEPGTVSSLDIGDGLTATVPIADVNKAATVDSVDQEPQAAEDIEDYRQTVIESYRTEPQGGSAGDYRIWSNDAQGVAAVYPYTAADNEVDLYVESTIADSDDNRGTPTDAMLDDVEAVVEQDPDTTKDINDRGRRPLNVIVNVLPVDVLDVEIDIADFEDNTAAKQALILASIQELIDDVRPFIAGADVLADRNDRLDTNKIIAKIYEAVPGAVFGAIVLQVDGNPVSSYLFDNGEIPYLADVTYS